MSLQIECCRLKDLSSSPGPVAFFFGSPSRLVISQKGGLCRWAGFAPDRPGVLSYLLEYGWDDVKAGLQ